MKNKFLLLGVLAISVLVNNSAFAAGPVPGEIKCELLPKTEVLPIKIWSQDPALSSVRADLIEFTCTRDNMQYIETRVRITAEVIAEPGVQAKATASYDQFHDRNFQDIQTIIQEATVNTDRQVAFDFTPDILPAIISLTIEDRRGRLELVVFDVYELAAPTRGK